MRRRPGARCARSISRRPAVSSDCPSYDRYRLPAGGAIEGPAIVEEIDSTTVIHPGFRAGVDRFGNLLIRPGT